LDRVPNILLRLLLRVLSPVGLGIRRFGWRGRGEERGVRSSIGSMLGGFVFGKSLKHKRLIQKAISP
jgi:hypothetical protein